MASCAHPSTVSSSKLWSFCQDQDISSSDYGWPSNICERKLKQQYEDDTNKVLDFARLESDILKNVLGEEDNFKEENVPVSTDVFPSYNYLPAPIPHSLLKANPILKLYPRDHVMSTMRFFDKQTQSFQTATSLSVSNSPERVYKPTLEQQMKQCNPNNQHQTEVYLSTQHRFISPPESTHLNGSPIKPFYSHGTRAPNITSNQLFTTPVVTTSYQYTPPVTTQAFIMSSCNPTTYKLPNRQGHTKERLLGSGHPCHAYYSTEVTKKESPKLFEQATSRVVTPPVAMATQSESQRQQPAGTNRTSAAVRRNMVPRTGNRNDPKKRRISGEETVLTFAQIVAASRPVEGRSDRYHE